MHSLARRVRMAALQPLVLAGAWNALAGAAGSYGHAATLFLVITDTWNALAGASGS